MKEGFRSGMRRHHAPKFLEDYVINKVAVVECPKVIDPDELKFQEWISMEHFYPDQQNMAYEDVCQLLLKKVVPTIHSSMDDTAPPIGSFLWSVGVLISSPVRITDIFSKIILGYTIARTGEHCDDLT
jgi:hypothetical protein